MKRRAIPAKSRRRSRWDLVDGREEVAGFADRPHEVLDIDGFDYKSIRAQFIARDPVAFFPGTGRDHYRDELQLEIVPDALEDFEPADLWHLQVQQHRTAGLPSGTSLNFPRR